MIIERLTSVTGIDNSIQGFKDLYNKQYYSASKNFAESTLRCIGSVGIVATCILAAAVVYTFIPDPIERKNEMLLQVKEFKNPVKEVDNFCSFPFEGLASHNNRRISDLGHEQCISDVFTKISEKSFNAIISDPYKTSRIVQDYCELKKIPYYNSGTSDFTKCWESVSKDIQIMDRLIPLAVSKNRIIS